MTPENSSRPSLWYIIDYFLIKQTCINNILTLVSEVPKTLQFSTESQKQYQTTLLKFFPQLSKTGFQFYKKRTALKENNKGFSPPIWHQKELSSPSLWVHYRLLFDENLH